MKARYIQEIGTKGSLRIYWDTYQVTSVRSCDLCPDQHPVHESQNACPNCLGTHKPGYHNAETPLGTVPQKSAWEAFGKRGDHDPAKWPTACDHCGALVPPHQEPKLLGEQGTLVNHQVFTKRLYNTPSGDPEPGDIYEMECPTRICPYWDNCSGIHIYSLLPNGAHWDMDSRASNCTLKDDRTHRCWIRHGTPEADDMTVDKNGHTCAAGAGSIAVPGWHGFLTGGQFLG